MNCKTSKQALSKPINSDASPILRTLAMPADTNANGDIFGGWIMSQMDIAGGILAKETARPRVVTVAVDSFKFLKPVKVTEAIFTYVAIDAKGRKRAIEKR